MQLQNRMSYKDQQNEMKLMYNIKFNNVQRQDLWQSETKIRITPVCTLCLNTLHVLHISSTPPCSAT